jgi:hypothetical protein
MPGEQDLQGWAMHSGHNNPYDNYYQRSHIHNANTGLHTGPDTLWQLLPESPDRYQQLRDVRNGMSG